MKVLEGVRALGLSGLLLASFTLPGAAATDTGAAQAAVVKLCDTLAADPEDGARPGEIAGIALEKIDATTAGAACEAALALAPDTPRMAYNLGRTLVASGNFIDAATHLRAAADAGYGAALRVIGDMYAKGQGFAVDAAKADEFYAKATAAGDTSVGLREVDKLLLTDDDADRAKALELLEAAAEKGDTAAQVRAAIVLEDRSSDVMFGPDNDLLVAERYLKAAVAAKWPGAETELLRLHLSGSPFDEAAAMADLVAAAEGGDPWAMTKLAEEAIVSEVGPYAELDATAQFDAGTEWLKKAAALDYPDAIYQLAANYSWGAGSLTADQAQAEQLYKRAADMGQPQASGRYGFILYRAADTDAEYAQAARYFTQARDGGESDGAVGLGHLYSAGYGVKQDFALAIDNYKAALEDGFSGVAAYELARIYDKQPAYRDPKVAADYLVKATAGLDVPEDEAKAGFKEFSRETRVALQQELISRKLLSGKADGSFGPASYAAYLDLEDSSGDLE